ncbi:MAG: GtrA family protein [Rhizobiales bacterium]|nr:GtrA family protein [Hyphomicrobiales bacterium]
MFDPRRLLRDAPLRRFVLFLAVGVLNTVFGYGLYFGLSLTGLLPEMALLFATIVGVLFNFLTTGRLVFDNRDRRKFGRFIGVYAAIYVLNALLLRGLISAGFSPQLSQLLLLPAIVVVNFAAMRLFVFQSEAIR